MHCHTDSFAAPLRSSSLRALRRVRSPFASGPVLHHSTVAPSAAHHTHSHPHRDTGSILSLPPTPVVRSATVMPEPTVAHGGVDQRYIALKQQAFESGGSEVPQPDKIDGRQPTDFTEEQKAGPIGMTRSSEAPPQPHPPPMGHSTSTSMPPPPPPFHFGSYANRSEWQTGRTSRPPLPPTYGASALSHHHHHHHLHAPRASHPYESGSSRLRGDGFLLDAEDEPDGIDLSNPADSDPLPMQMQRAVSAGDDAEAAEAAQERIFGMPMLNDSMERPRSAGPAYTSGSSSLTRNNTGEVGPPTALVCPSCGEQPAGADAEQSFHAHVSRCFVTQLSASPARPPTRGQPNGSPIDNSGGPIRKTRNRAASAAAATGTAAELASALAQPMPTTPEAHGYHPYSGNNSALSSTLRQLRRTVDQLDLHQRISIMEAFHRLSRAALTESQSSTPRGGKTKLRSATNSPSPKHKPMMMEDKVCNNIMSLLYSPRITAPHPSPSFQMSALQIGVPSPLVIGLASADHADPNSVILSSPVSAMDTLELGAVHAATSKSYLFAPSSPEPAASPLDDAVFSPSSIMVTDADGSESEVGAGSLALTGAFGHGLNSGSSSPASSTPSGQSSEQTSPEAPTDAFAVDAHRHLDRFPTHCYPDSSLLPLPTPAQQGHQPYHGQTHATPQNYHDERNEDYAQQMMVIQA